MPMAATVAYLTSRGVQGDRLGTDIGRVAALTQWRLGRGVYQIDPEVAGYSTGALWHSAGGGGALAAGGAAAGGNLDSFARMVLLRGVAAPGV